MKQDDSSKTGELREEINTKKYGYGQQNYGSMERTAMGSTHSANK